SAELLLPLPLRRHPVHFPRAGVEGGKQVQRPTPPIFMFDQHGLARTRCLGGGLAGPRLQVGLLIDAQDHLKVMGDEGKGKMVTVYGTSTTIISCAESHKVSIANNLQRRAF